ncbi:MAG: choice-of-anchor D domain-containing protein [Candidatus Marinimicrobia bacterium]|nr:choice-of-anchor D domain-containing protein [Candidatus Neomarinimicrobiota bacterium]
MNRKKLCILIILVLPMLLIGQQWTILATYTIPGKASGLAYDGTYLYSGIYGSNGDEVHRINPADGTNTLLFSNTSINDSYGMTWDGNHLWITDHVTSSSVPATAVQLDLNGTILSQFNLPDHYMSGIASDNGDFWVATYYLSGNPEYIYKVNSTGVILDTLLAPAAQPWDLCLENGDLWVADYYDNTLFKVDTSSGAIIESHLAENDRPAGIVYDGQYLWYVDGALSSPSTLYKVDLGGTGTPVIELSFDQHDFENVNLGSSGSMNLTITNGGTGDLTISGINFTNNRFSSTFTVPQTITPSGSINASLLFTPLFNGPAFGMLTIDSNDPIDPQIQVELTGYGLTQVKDIEVEYTQMDFYNIRIGAHTAKRILISNQGATGLTISDINFDNAAFYLDPGQALPTYLATRDTLSLRYWFSPPTTGQYLGTMTIVSDDPDEPNLAVTVAGEGILNDPTMGTELWYLNSNQENEKVIAFRNFVDITGDGIRELLVADNEYQVHCVNGNSSGEADILWTFNSQLGTYWTGSIYQEPGLKVTGDLNGDDLADVVVGTAWGSRSIFAVDGSDGSIIWYFDSHTIGDGGWIYEIDGKYDFNADGVPDILACAGDDSYGTGPKRVWLFDGTNGNLIWQHLFGVAIASVISIEDATGDGIPEVVCGESVNSSSAYVYLLNGANGNTLYSWNSGSSAVMALTTIADGNGDGLEDFCYGDFQGDFVAHSTTNTFLWSVSLGSGLITHLDKLTTSNGEYILPSLLGNYTYPVIDTDDGSFLWSISPGGYTLDSAPITDIDADGINDVLIGTYDGSSGNHRILVASGSDGQSVYDYTPGSPVEQVIAIDDLDGNGSSEIVYGLRNGYLYCISGGTDGSQTNNPPAITAVSHAPAYPSSDDDVWVSATITDDISIISATCYWGNDSISFPNSITMIPVGGLDRFQTASSIPAESAGFSVYYFIEAQDLTDTTTSPVFGYTVFDPPSLFINEIMYNSPEVADNEWIELYNGESVALDLAGYYLKTGSSATVLLILPAGASIAPGEYFTIALSTGTPPLPFVPDYDGSGSITLNDNGDLISLYDPNGPLVNSLVFDDVSPWPPEPDGAGPSLELIAPTLDNTLATSWQTSWITGGTPGTVNSDSTMVGTNPDNHQQPHEFTLHQNYPNPFNPRSTIPFALPVATQVNLSVFDLTGHRVAVLIDDYLEAGYYTKSFLADGLASGIYLYRLKTNRFVSTKKLIIVK